jgi:predicted metalloendopeptidase
LAFRAYRAIRTDAPEQLVADGFDEDKQFFLSVGQVWCSKYREEFARMRASTDTHSQPNWRVNGSLRNTPEFAETFQCKEGSGMRPASTCSVW